jgi:hypothetical protein
MGIDPVGVDENNVHSHNRYAYANNNPYRFVDPDGRIALPIAILGAGLATAGIIYYWDKTFGAILQNSSNSNSDETAKLLGLGNSTASSGGMPPDDDDPNYRDSTKGKSVQNTDTNLTKDQYIKELEGKGYKGSPSKDGKVTNFNKDGSNTRYSVRDSSKSGDKGPTAERLVNDKVVEKIRLGKDF